MKAITVLLLLAATGCAGGVPRFEPTAVSVQSMGPYCGFSVEGLEAYIDRYGREGWILGLSDERSLIPESASSSRQDGDREDLRIREAFYHYYCLRFPGPGREGVRSVATTAERDAVADRALAHLKSSPER